MKANGLFPEKICVPCIVPFFSIKHAGQKLTIGLATRCGSGPRSLRHRVSWGIDKNLKFVSTFSGIKNVHQEVIKKKLSIQEMMLELRKNPLVISK